MKPNLFLLMFTFLGCASTSSDWTSVSQRKILFPFVETKPIASSQPKEAFVIRTVTGVSRLEIEIPDAGEEYNVEIPIDQVQNLTSDTSVTPTQNDISSYQTDKEMTKGFPKGLGSQSALTDKSFGVAENPRPTRDMSYAFGLAKIKDFFSKHQFEQSLMQVDELLGYYPNSPELLKMKGTLFRKLNRMELAIQAWDLAYQLNPKDHLLKENLDHLRKQYETMTGEIQNPFTDSDPKRETSPSKKTRSNPS